jgi:hypothetical protein
VLSLEEDELRGCWVVQDTMEVHCVIDLILGLKDFLKLKVVMTISECIKIDITIIFPK